MGFKLCLLLTSHGGMGVKSRTGWQLPLLTLTKWKKKLLKMDRKKKKKKKKKTTPVLLKAGPLAKVPTDSVGLGLGLEFCISNLLPVEVDAARGRQRANFTSKALHGVDQEIW